MGDEERYPAAWGVFVHEAAHAAHSVWTAPAGANPRVVEAALLLEESRVEGAHLVTRPTDRTSLRTSARTLVVPDLAHPTLQGIERAAAVAALVLGRRDVGILDAGETRAVAGLCEKVLGAGLLATLTRIWTAAHQRADHDATTMLAHAHKWCDALDTAAPALPVPENLTDLLSGAVGVVMDTTAATDAADLAAQAAATNAKAVPSKAQARDRTQRAASDAKPPPPPSRSSTPVAPPSPPTAHRRSTATRSPAPAGQPPPSSVPPPTASGPRSGPPAPPRPAASICARPSPGTLNARPGRSPPRNRSPTPAAGTPPPHRCAWVMAAV
ncbi:hypothetical protein GCM10010286_00920 [Streptomyces toxytricini]|nr:hypothetical protein GCM10010286_00920 [Streptomyces toxytricini]